MALDNSVGAALETSLDEYDEILLGKRKTYSAFFMNKQNGNRIIKRALKYCFENYLQWTPVQVRECLTPEIVKRMKLEGLINRVPCPPELNPQTELYYVAWWLYPETRNVSAPELMVKVYDDVLSGRISKFPKGYFDGILGAIHAKAILLLMIKRYMTFDSLESMYAFFANEREARSILNRYRLSVPLRELYDTPLDYLHDSLSGAQKSSELYQKYSQKKGGHTA